DLTGADAVGGQRRVGEGIWPGGGPDLHVGEDVVVAARQRPHVGLIGVGSVEQVGLAVPGVEEVVPADDGRLAREDQGDVLGQQPGKGRLVVLQAGGQQRLDQLLVGLAPGLLGRPGGLRRRCGGCGARSRCGSGFGGRRCRFLGGGFGGGGFRCGLGGRRRGGREEATGRAAAAWGRCGFRGGVGGWRGRWGRGRLWEVCWGPVWGRGRPWGRGRLSWRCGPWERGLRLLRRKEGTCIALACRASPPDLVDVIYVISNSSTAEPLPGARSY